MNPETRERARRLAEAARDRKAENVVALAVGPLTSFADAFVLATAASDRQGRAIADAVREAAKEIGMPLLGTEGYEDGRWILIDCGDVIVHIFVREAREHYDLDRLWGDAERIELPEPAEATAR
ncbi:MAG: ribosome silencing factor [Myxococcota bacterium]